MVIEDKIKVSPEPIASQQGNNSSGDAFLRQDQVKTISNWTKIKHASKFILSNMKYQIFITILTIYSLFSDDFRTALFDKTVDSYFDVLSIIVMAIFTIQIVLSSWVIQDYFLSFFFFLDVLSTISIIFDINFISDIIFSTGSTSTSVSKMAAQSKASRTATRAIRIVKLFRIIRIIKLYKNAQKAKELKEFQKKKQALKENLDKKKNKKIDPPSLRDQQANPQYSNNTMIVDNRAPGKKIYPQQTMQQKTKESLSISDEQLQKVLQKQSKIGKILSQMSIKKIIIVVLLMMFIIPLFNIDQYNDPQNCWDNLLIIQQKMLQSTTSQIPTSQIIKNIQNDIKQFLQTDDYIIGYKAPFKQISNYPNQGNYKQTINVNTLRSQDSLSSIQIINTDLILKNRNDLTFDPMTEAEDRNVISVVLNQNTYNRRIAAFGMFKTLFVCIVLLVLMYFFNRDVETLLVQPIQNMMDKLLMMAKDPQSAAKEQLSSNTELETTVISNAIIKIGALLSTVFGSAGAEIIGTNIIEEGDMNPMIEGKKKCAIFGFCDIRYFTEVTEVLQEQILIFVNKIGSLVHQSVYRYGGSANKNIGEAFLLVWKIPEEKYHLDMMTNEIQWKDRRYLSVLSDFAVLGFVKTLIKIHKDPVILEYGMDERLQKKMDKYKVSMGFGLHVGWAIEGAIGSQYKIDASYLSPNVNMASRLQAATKQFGVDFLISQDLYELLTPDMKDFFRNIDRVTVKGSQKPIRLYTVDLAYDRITPPQRKDLKYPDPADMPDSQTKKALNMQYLKEEQIQNYNARKFVQAKKELRQVLINSIPEDFKKRFQLGVSCYLKGKWGDSRLHEAMKFKTNDGPTKTILNYMKKFNFTAPATWKQYRPLTSK